jgi:antitoxin MazE
VYLFDIQEYSMSSRNNASKTFILRRSTISKWGNSLGVRIPQEATEHLQLRAGEKVQLEVGADSITIRPSRKRRRKWTLKALLKGVTPAKVGGELDWGPAVGKELL